MSIINRPDLTSGLEFIGYLFGIGNGVIYNISRDPNIKKTHSFLMTFGLAMVGSIGIDYVTNGLIDDPILYLFTITGYLTPYLFKF